MQEGTQTFVELSNWHALIVEQLEAVERPLHLYTHLARSLSWQELPEHPPPSWAEHEVAQALVAESKKQVGFCVHVAPVTDVTCEHLVKHVCDALSHMQAGAAMQTVCDTNWPVQESEQTALDAFHAQSPEASHDEAS